MSTTSIKRLPYFIQQKIKANKMVEEELSNQHVNTLEKILLKSTQNDEKTYINDHGFK